MTWALILVLHGPWPARAAHARPWLRPPVTRIVPLEQQVRQFDTGHPTQTVRRSRMELWQAAVAANQPSQ